MKSTKSYQFLRDVCCFVGNLPSDMLVERRILPRIKHPASRSITESLKFPALMVSGMKFRSICRLPQLLRFSPNNTDKLPPMPKQHRIAPIFSIFLPFLLKTFLRCSSDAYFYLEWVPFRSQIGWITIFGGQWNASLFTYVHLVCPVQVRTNWRCSKLHW